jgi:hypothetical protein
MRGIIGTMLRDIDPLGLKEGVVEIKNRRTKEARKVRPEDVLQALGR